MSRHRIAALLFAVATVPSTLLACASREQPTRVIEPLSGKSDVAASLVKKQVSRDQLAAHRKLQIERLHAYTVAGKFPHNPSDSPAPIHMFKDADGNLCPIANLIHADGKVALVDEMVKTHNDVVVADETSGPLHDWVSTSGLTNEEVRRIQGVGFPGEYAFGPGGSIPPSVMADVNLMAHLQKVEQELRDATDASLDLAVARLDEHALAAL